VFVIFAVTLMSLAAGAGLLAQLGLAIWWAMVGALAIYAGLLSLHLVARRQFASLDQAANERLQAEINALMPDGSELSDSTDDAEGPAMDSSPETDVGVSRETEPTAEPTVSRETAPSVSPLTSVPRASELVSERVPEHPYAGDRSTKEGAS